MTKDDIIKLAREAGFLVDGDSWIHAGAVLVDGRKSIDKQLERFANLVAAAERAECAKLCEKTDDGTPYNLAEACAAAIRARGTT